MLAILEVAISLALVFFLFCVTSSFVVESLAALFNLRGRTLREGVKGMLSGRSQTVAEHLDRFYSHPLIAALSGKGRLPSYLPSHLFATVILDNLFRGGEEVANDFASLKSLIDGLPDSSLKISLRAHLYTGEQTVEGYGRRLEAWFDYTMDRVSGWYKRQAQLLTFLVGMAVAASFNIDAVGIGKALWYEPEIRAGLVKAAEQLAQDQPPPPYAASVPVQQAFSNLGATGLPIGWEGHGFSPLMVLGWLLSALAAVPGAQFWFDVVSRLVGLRATGRQLVSLGANVGAAK